MDGAALLGCSVTGEAGAGAGQQLHVQGGQVWPSVQAGQAQPHPPPVPEPLPPSGVTTGVIRAQVPVGQGVVMHSMVKEVQPHASAVSAVQEAASVCAVQGSAGSVPQPQGAQAVLAGQAGQPQTDTVAEPLPVFPPGCAVPEPDAAVVMVVVEPLVHEQLQAGQASPAGQTGQLQVQVPGPPPEPVPPPEPLAPPAPVPQPPLVPPAPPVPPLPHWQSQGGQASPGRQAGQPQVQVPPPPLPASTGCGGGQSHCTGGQAPFAGQASGWTQRQVVVGGRSKQKPPPPQS